MFSTWADANSGEALASEYSDNVLAMYCQVTMYSGTDYVTSETDQTEAFCFAGSKVIWGGGHIGSDFFTLAYELGADVTEPAVGETLPAPADTTYEGFNIVQVDSSNVGRYKTTW